MITAWPPRVAVIAPDGRMPGSSILDRFHDWQDAMEDATCTRECGAARNDTCFCRCKGLHHNAAHDYWATQPRKVITTLPGGHVITRVNREAPAESLADRIRYLESIGQPPGCTCDWSWKPRLQLWTRKNTIRGCPAHDTCRR